MYWVTLWGYRVPLQRGPAEAAAKRGAQWGWCAVVYTIHASDLRVSLSGGLKMEACANLNGQPEQQVLDLICSSRIGFPACLICHCAGWPGVEEENLK